MGWKVFYFQTRSGHLPVREFIAKQDIKTQARIRQSIVLLRDKGPFLKSPYVKKLRSGLSELRIKSQISIRIFYSPKNNAYYLLHAFKKKSQQIPARELRTALDRMKDLI
ncbi:MAG: type II toxin-antitoxin system RelE/ParE family toxin [Patescibacteria group bacterium]